MKIFKFGGASIKNTSGIRNVSKIIKNNADSLLIVVSALGKTTNHLEELLDVCYYNKPDKELLFSQIKKEHFAILNELFNADAKDIFEEIEHLFHALYDHIQGGFSENFDFEYDQIISYGELISSKMLYFYLQSMNIPVVWVDARQIIRTDNAYREGHVDWEKTIKKTKKIIEPHYQGEDKRTVITQGFIGGTSEGFTTTLGREGSDFSAAIFGFSLDAESVTIWKDVEGLLNADPKFFPDTVKLDRIPYREAIELAYYGASIIHPKTLQPLQNKNIPLYVKSFINAQGEGSVIHDFGIKRLMPCYIVKREQVLISISPKDFSFIAEDNLSTIFGLFAFFGVKINLMQNSAISFSLCVDNKEKIDALIEELQTEFYVKYNSDVELFTIRYYDRNSIDRITKDRTVILEQKNRTTVQYIIRKKQLT
ncbi:MAG: aspartate kinase [Bacteroidales bacterium]|jgi:aspartate kinase|nr:aspartate kinase [Bacteroidales bacterium]